MHLDEYLEQSQSPPLWTKHVPLPGFTFYCIVAQRATMADCIALLQVSGHRTDVRRFNRLSVERISADPSGKGRGCALPAAPKMTMDLRDDRGAFADSPTDSLDGARSHVSDREYAGN